MLWTKEETRLVEEGGSIRTVSGPVRQWPTEGQYHSTFFPDEWLGKTEDNTQSVLSGTKTLDIVWVTLYLTNV